MSTFTISTGLVAMRRETKKAEKIAPRNLEAASELALLDEPATPRLGGNPRCTRVSANCSLSRPKSTPCCPDPSAGVKLWLS